MFIHNGLASKRKVRARRRFGKYHILYSKLVVNTTLPLKWYVSVDATNKQHI